MYAQLRLFAQATLARTYPRVAWMFRNNSWMLQETVLPLLAVAAFAYVYQAMNAPPEFVGFVILGAAMMTFWRNVLWSMGAHLYWERDGGNLELYIMAPAPMASILAGMAIGGLTTTLVRAVAILVAGAIIFDVPFHPTSWWTLTAVFLMTMLALYGMGMVFASVFLLWGREAWHTVNMLQEPVYLMTGMNFPVKILGELTHRAVPILASAIPLTLGMDAMRQILFRSDGLFSVAVEIVLLVVMSGVFIVAAILALRFMERKAREDGKLTVRWQ